MMWTRQREREMEVKGCVKYEYYFKYIFNVWTQYKYIYI